MRSPVPFQPATVGFLLLPGRAQRRRDRRRPCARIESASFKPANPYEALRLDLRIETYRNGKKTAVP